VIKNKAKALNYEGFFVSTHFGGEKGANLCVHWLDDKKKEIN